jgi:hypothetical protein
MLKLGPIGELYLTSRLASLKGFPQLQSLQSLTLYGCTGLKPAAVNEFKTKRPDVTVGGP